MAKIFDNLDLLLLEKLQRDATRPVADLADSVGSSKSVCWRRIKRFLDEGIIRERVAILDPKKTGFDVMVIAQVKMGRHGRDVLPNFVQSVRRFPQVIECHTLMGNVDFLLKIVVRDVTEYERFFWQELSQIEGVLEVSSSIVLTQFVNTTRLPISHGAFS